MWRFWRRKSKPHFETQYDDLLPVMYLAANKILHNAQDAEDAVQEALAVMCEKFTKKFTKWMSKNAWLRRYDM